NVLKTAAKIVEMIKASLPDRSVKVVAEYMDVEESLSATAADQRPPDPGTMAGYKYLFHGEDTMELNHEFGRLSREEILVQSTCKSVVTIDQVYRWIDAQGYSDVEKDMAKDFCLAFALFKLLKRRFYGYVPAEAGSAKALSLVLDGHRHRPRRRVPGRRGGAGLPLRLLLHPEHRAGGRQDVHLHRRRRAGADHVDGVLRHARPRLPPPPDRRQGPRPLRHGGGDRDHRGARDVPGAGGLLQQLEVHQDGVPLRARRPALAEEAARRAPLVEGEPRAAGREVLGGQDRGVRAAEAVRAPPAQSALVAHALPGGAAAAGAEAGAEEGAAAAGPARRARLAQGEPGTPQQRRLGIAEARPAAAAGVGVRVLQVHRPDPGVAHRHHALRLGQASPRRSTWRRRSHRRPHRRAPAGGDEAVQLLRVPGVVRAGDAAGPELQRGADLRHDGAAGAVPPRRLQEQGRDPREAAHDRGRRAEVHGGRGGRRRRGGEGGEQHHRREGGAAGRAARGGRGRGRRAAVGGAGRVLGRIPAVPRAVGQRGHPRRCARRRRRVHDAAVGAARPRRRA
uniref:DUF4220 domain-containing protein n=1 Tax=Aegilops tauschii subsp. strangulata TaxID=200361 RepID=A0A452ZHV9_AEGTS